MHVSVEQYYGTDMHKLHFRISGFNNMKYSIASGGLCPPDPLASEIQHCFV